MRHLPWVSVVKHKQHHMRRNLASLLLALGVAGCEMGSDDGPNAPYKATLNIRTASGEKDFELGRYKDLSRCGGVVEFELRENNGKAVWIRPDWGYLSGSSVEGWIEGTVVGGGCFPA
jgi:hypothetical protein